MLNLRQMKLKCGNLNDIRSFVCHAPNLLKVKFEEFSGDIVQIDESEAMNAERMKLFRARKIVIFIDEENHLKMKWNGKINFDLIELKRGVNVYFI